MNVYAVCIPEERVDYSYDEPPEVGVPLGIFAAETEGRAKADALRAWTRRRIGVNSDDYLAIRARLLGTTLDGRGEILGSEVWARWPGDWPIIERAVAA